MSHIYQQPTHPAINTTHSHSPIHPRHARRRRRPQTTPVRHKKTLHLPLDARPIPLGVRALERAHQRLALVQKLPLAPPKLLDRGDDIPAREPARGRIVEGDEHLEGRGRLLRRVVRVLQLLLRVGVFGDVERETGEPGLRGELDLLRPVGGRVGCGVADLVWWALVWEGCRRRTSAEGNHYAHAASVPQFRIARHYP